MILSAHWKVRTIFLLLAFFVAYFLSLSLVGGDQVIGIEGALLGPFFLLLLNEPSAWMVPALVSLATFMPAAIVQNRWITGLSVFVGAAFWLIIGLMGVGLQI